MEEYGYGQWELALLNVVLFSLFLLFIPLKKKLEQRSAGVMGANYALGRNVASVVWIKKSEESVLNVRSIFNHISRSS